MIILFSGILATSLTTHGSVYITTESYIYEHRFGPGREFSRCLCKVGTSSLPVSSCHVLRNDFRTRVGHYYSKTFGSVLFGHMDFLSNCFLQIIYGSKFNYHTIAQNFMILQGSYLKVLCWEVWAIWNVYAPVNGCCISILVIMDHVLRIAHDCTKIYSVHHMLFENRNRSLVLFYSHLSFSQIMSCFDWKIKSWECFLESMRSLKLNNIFGNYQSVAQALRLASFHGTYCWCDYSHRSPSWVRYFFSGTQSVV